MAASDPPRGSQSDLSLRADYGAMVAARERRYDRLEEMLDKHAAQVDALLARERAAAEVVAEQPVAEEPATPEPVERRVPDPPAADLDQLAASSAMGSPAHMEWRRQHSSPGRGIFGGGW